MCRRPSLLVAVVCTVLTAGPSLAVVCPCLYSELGGRCLLFLPNLALTWPQARAVCANINGTLAKVDDCTLLGQIARNITFNTDLTPEQGYWIGGTDEGQEGNFTWEDGSDVPRHMPFWGTYYIQGDVYPEPNGDRSQNCLGLLSSDRYYFHDVECDRQMAVLCEAPYTEEPSTTIETADDKSLAETSDGTSEEVSTDASSSAGTSDATSEEVSTDAHSSAETSDATSEEVTTDAHSSAETSLEPDTTTVTAPCPLDYVLVGGACFKFYQDAPVSWSAATRRCTTDGGALATLGDCNLLADVAAYINENGLQPGSLGYWIGATDEASEGLFRWTDDDSLVPLRMPFWGSTEVGPEPNGGDIENCVILDASDRYFFHDVMCSTERAVLCRAPAPMRVGQSRRNDC